MDIQNFYRGDEFEAYRFLGAHFGDGYTTFRTFAPGAVRISVIGDFNGWNETPMGKVQDGNFWECTIKDADPGMMYKYRIYKKDGSCTDHVDPYGFFSEKRPGHASIIATLDSDIFTDKKWLDSRGNHYDKPINMYEMHFGSWRKKDEDTCYSYDELAEVLIPYLKKNGYNYVELMPLNEYPADESWGYQGTGFFSPTSRYGNPDGLRRFINKCHENDIGVIMDFIAVHFAVDDYALRNYDGTALYEYPNAAVGYNEWGSCNFMHSRGEVRSFLQSAAYYWLKEFHFDGLRFDAVSNLIYWQGNVNRGENKPATDFLKGMNNGLKERIPDIMLIAEDSSSYPRVTQPAWANGLGFDYKWDMGWMNDTLDYFRLPPDKRTEKYHMLTFSMMYYHSERFILPFSHDENVHGKATIIQKMNGQYEQKFPQARALYLYMMTHPGKKLNFMGGEIGQFREWDETREQDWDILHYPLHDAFRRYMKELNEIYIKNPALWENDYRDEGFQWIDCHCEQKCVYVYKRCGGGQTVAAVFNFSDRNADYSLHIENASKLRLLIDTDNQIYGGNTVPDAELKLQDGTVNMVLSPFSGRLYQIAFQT
ncbi:MAG: 1,4-alpha-glucan branching protein GlgB [Oscillospiraceae bacterium]|nr:1,4-alpha-glucan branching protein GlgB [Oscillospiraceae bacterium]